MDRRRVRYCSGSSATVRSFRAILSRTDLSSFRNSSAASSENSTRNASRSFLFHQSLERDGLSRPDLSARLEDILDGLHAQAVFQGACDRIPDEFGLRREALFLGRRRKQLRLLFRKFEAYCLHTDCNTRVLLSSIDGHCECENTAGGPTVTIWRNSSHPRLD